MVFRVFCAGVLWVGGYCWIRINDNVSCPLSSVTFFRSFVEVFAFVLRSLVTVYCKEVKYGMHLSNMQFIDSFKVRTLWDKTT